MIILADAWFHTLSPFAVRFTEKIGIRWYGLGYAIGFLIGWAFVKWLGRTGRSPIHPRKAGDFMMAIVLGVLLGGRIGYALFYERSLFFTFTSAPPYWDLLAINKGGMASHGGMIGVMVACWWFAYRNRIPVLHLFDLAALGSTPGLFLGRIANFLNGELLGFAVADQAAPPWWSVKFPQEMTDWLRDGAVTKLESLRDAVGNLGVTSGEWMQMVHAAAIRDPDAMASVGAVIHRLILATQRGDLGVINSLKLLLAARHPSQLYQAFTDGPILALLLGMIWLKPRRPGVIAGWFMILYALLRLATEHYRMPDAGVEMIMGLSRGRFLSLFMIITGAAILWLVHCGRQSQIGGLLRRPSSK